MKFAKIERFLLSLYRTQYHYLLYIGLWYFSMLFVIITFVCLIITTSQICFNIRECSFCRYYLSISLPLLITYYIYRLIQPREKWPLLITNMSETLQKYPIFEQQNLIFEDLPENEFIKPDSKTMLCYHPHGILCMGQAVNGAIAPRMIDSDICQLGAQAMFRLLPFISDFLSFVGGDVISNSNFVRLLQDGRNVAFLPGGFEEATIFDYGKFRVYLKNRKGFIKYALKFGYKVRPVYSFGEEQTFRNCQRWLKFRLQINKFQLPTVFFRPILPRTSFGMYSVVGRPVELPKIDHPSSKDIDYWHQKYIERLQQVFDKYKTNFYENGKAITLEVF